MNKRERKLISKQNHSKQSLHKFKMFLIEYGYYKEINDLYVANHIPTILPFNCATYISVILENRQPLFRVFGRQYNQKIKELQELNDLWLLEIIYNDYSYEDKLQALRQYNGIHRWELESTVEVINGKKIYSLKPKTIPISVLKNFFKKD